MADKNNKQKSFCAKVFFLTYPQLELEKEDILDSLHIICEKNKNSIKRYAIGKEKH